MKAIPLVRASAVLPFVKFLNQIGSPSERLLQSAGLSNVMFDDPETLISLHQSFVFAERAARLEGIENLGLLVAQQTPVTQMGALGQLACQSLTLYDLLQTITELLHTHNSGARVWLTQQGEHTLFHHQFLSATTPNQQAQYFTLQSYLNALQLVMGKQWQPDQLWTPARAVKGLADSALFAETPIQFNASHNVIRFPTALLSLPLQASVVTAPCHFYREALQSSAPSADFLEALQQLIRSLMQDRCPTVEAAAMAAGMSTRSLQRRLTEHSLCYSRVVEQVRFGMAVQLLQDPAIKLIEIAFELGYTDAANFTHAFKRWTGVSPREFRRRHFSSNSSLA